MTISRALHGAITLVLPIAACLLSVACARNAAYLYETEKCSLTLEARPDPSQPISGSLGLKQRVVAVIPPRSEAGSAITPGVGPDADAVSVLSSFDFHKHKPTGILGTSSVDIRSAMITGRAALALSPEQLPGAIDAITVRPTPTLSQILSAPGGTGGGGIVQRVRRRPADWARLVDLMSLPPGQLTAAQLRELEAITGLTGQLMSGTDGRSVAQEGGQSARLLTELRRAVEGATPAPPVADAEEVRP